MFSEGETLDEAKTNLLDALTQVMEYYREEARKNAATANCQPSKPARSTTSLATAARSLRQTVRLEDNLRDVPRSILAFPFEILAHFHPSNLTL